MNDIQSQLRERQQRFEELERLSSNVDINDLFPEVSANSQDSHQNNNNQSVPIIEPPSRLQLQQQAMEQQQEEKFLQQQQFEELQSQPRPQQPPQQHVAAQHMTAQHMTAQQQQLCQNGNYSNHRHHGRRASMESLGPSSSLLRREESIQRYKEKSARKRKKRAEIPTEFLCPITREIMFKPVLTLAGHTYEKDAIEQWLATHSTESCFDFLFVSFPFFLFLYIYICFLRYDLFFFVWK